MGNILATVSYGYIGNGVEYAAGLKALEKLRKEVFQAIEDKDVEKLKTFLKFIAVSQLGVNAEGDTALFAAVECGDEAVLSALLDAVPEEERSAIIRQSNKEGYTALHAAAGIRNASAVSILLNALPEYERADYAQQKFIEHLYNMETTALHVVAQFGDFDVATVLLNAVPESERAAVVLAADQKGRTALHDAAQLDKGNVITAFLHAIPANARAAVVQQTDKSGNTALHFAGSIFAGYYIRMHNYIDRMTAVGSACLPWKDQAGTVAALLNFLSKNECAAALQQLDQNGNTAMYSSVKNRKFHVVFEMFKAAEEAVFHQIKLIDFQSFFFDAVCNGTLPLVQGLLRHEVGVDALDILKIKEFSSVLKIKNTKMLVFLLDDAPQDKQLSFVNQVNYLGDTLMINLARERNFQMVQCLLRYGADKDIINKKKRNALMYAVDNNDASMVALLCDPKATELMHAESEKLDGLLQKPDVDVDAFDGRGWNALMYAIDRGEENTERRLQEKGADADLAQLMFEAHYAPWNMVLGSLQKYAKCQPEGGDLKPAVKNGLEILQQNLQTAVEKNTNAHMTSCLEQGIALIDELV